MRETTLELAVGDVVVIGDKTMTVIDIDGEEISFRMDTISSSEPSTYSEPSLHRDSHSPSGEFKRKAR